MRDVQHALDALSAALGLGGLGFDGRGNLTLVLDGSTRLNLHRLDETNLEIWTRIEGLGNTGDASLLAAMLVANHLGEGTGHARLALTPDRSAVVLCERIGIAGLDAGELESRIAAFLRHLAFWNSAQARSAISGGAPSELAADAGFMIRA